MRFFLSFFAFIFLISCETAIDTKQDDFQIAFEKSDGTKTATYEEVIDFYLRLAKNHPEINVQTLGSTDSGHPLHLVTFNPESDFNFQKLTKSKTIVLVNNGIHPGESDGIDATMLLFRDLVEQKISAQKNVVLVTIPVYNIGGMLNRNSTTRTNQNGPEAYGFRGNAKNYDLNRDFIKADTKNARTFAEIFHLVSPDIFIDNHVSNGADYQYTLTHLFTQHNKLGGDLGHYLHTEMMPKLEQNLSKANWDITPYVNVFNRPPETGFTQFLDHPRYSTGYTTLWNTLGMMVETHMLKPYEKRVHGTYELMKQLLFIAEKDHHKIKQLRTKAAEAIANRRTYNLNWAVDTTKNATLRFKGFKVDTLVSGVTGFPRLQYDTSRPFEKETIYNNYFLPKDTVTIPEAYLLKKAWIEIAERMAMNNIAFYELETDTVLTVEAYRIATYSTRSNAYEGHYLHYDTSVDNNLRQVHFDKGDYIIPTNQPGMRYILETLEPQAPDSFFNWNFFDTILQQKEGFSPYVFEDIALKLLEENEPLRNRFLLKKQEEQKFAENWYAQLNWIYQNSPHYEAAHLQYPVYRILKGSEAASMVEN
ncbi:M14 family metallopeptidase [Croceitalea sp. MTPC5]|uniref:M14 family metallopeptidase n=1 Tax=Croceitalea sp. MTPC5 TaxID=3056565 RepID=UPI002B3C0ECB|nr:M14 family metallopeptidase [Croceitalea sp. MTPC5]